MSKFDIASYLRETEGMDVVGAGSKPGSVVVRMPKSTAASARFGAQEFEEKEFDASGYLKAKGQDIGDAEVTVGRPSAPVENQMGFLDRIAFAATRTEADKKRFLINEYGADEVAVDPETQTVRARKGGVWHDTDPGFLASIANESPAIAGGVQGAVVGSAAGPVGTVVGGAIGAGLGKLASVAEANAVGIRTEDDAESVSKEVAKEMAWSLAFGAAPYAAKGAAKLGHEQVAKALSKLNESATPEVKERFAKVLAWAAREQDPLVYSTWMNNADDVSKQHQKIAEWETQRSMQAALNERELANRAAKLQNQFGDAIPSKPSSFSEFDKTAGKKPIVGIFQAGDTPKQKASLDLTQQGSSTVNPVKKEMAKIVQDQVDYARRQMSYDFAKFENSPVARNAMTKSQIDVSDMPNILKGLADEAEKTAGTSDARHLSRVADRIRKLVVDGDKAKSTISFEDARTLRKNIDEILSSTGVYNQGDFAISSNTQRFLQQIRAGVVGRMEKGLADVSPRAAQEFRAVNQKYSQRRELLDVIGDKKLFDDDKVDNSLKALLGEKGERMRDTVVQLLGDASSKRNAEILRQLDVRNTALRTSRMFNFGESRTNLLIRKAANLGASSFNKLQALGKTSNFVSKMTPEMRKEMLKQPGAFDFIAQAINQATTLPEQVSTGLLTEAEQKLGQ